MPFDVFHFVKNLFIVLRPCDVVSTWHDRRRHEVRMYGVDLILGRMVIDAFDDDVNSLWFR